MYLSKKRVRVLSSVLKTSLPSQGFYISVEISSEKSKATLKSLGFSDSFKSGDTLLPSIIGPVTKRNAEGEEIKLKHLPKETHYRQALWNWTEFHGKNRVPMSKIVDIPYKKYPRQLISPQSVELTIVQVTDSFRLISPKLSSESDEKYIIHVMNIFFEAFGECEILDPKKQPLVITPVKRLNWKILPPGEYPWEKLKQEFQPLLRATKKGNRPAVENRLEILSTKKPDFTAVGTAGFNGYIIFGFKSKRVYVLESMWYGNATYILGDDWEKLSQTSKAEILNGKHHLARIIHKEGWKLKLDKVV